VTGFNILGDIGPKQLGLIHELLPHATRFAVLLNAGAATTGDEIPELRKAAAAIGREIEFLYAGTNNEIDTAFASLAEKRIDALLVNSQFLFVERRAQILGLTARHAVPVIWGSREDVEAGGLMSYGAKRSESYRQQGIYTGRILEGEKPADLPIMRSTKFEFVINLQTAKLLGIEVPPTLLALADEVIE
jgi:putative ABC transport system substrate-binding protein